MRCSHLIDSFIHLGANEDIVADGSRASSFVYMAGYGRYTGSKVSELNLSTRCITHFILERYPTTNDSPCVRLWELLVGRMRRSWTSTFVRIHMFHEGSLLTCRRAREFLCRGSVDRGKPGEREHDQHGGEHGGERKT